MKRIRYLLLCIFLAIFFTYCMMLFDTAKGGGLMYIYYILGFASLFIMPILLILAFRFTFGRDEGADDPPQKGERP